MVFKPIKGETAKEQRTRRVCSQMCEKSPQQSIFSANRKTIVWDPSQRETNFSIWSKTSTLHNLKTYFEDTKKSIQHYVILLSNGTKGLFTSCKKSSRCNICDTLFIIRRVGNTNRVLFKDEVWSWTQPLKQLLNRMRRIFKINGDKAHRSVSSARTMLEFNPKSRTIMM